MVNTRSGAGGKIVANRRKKRIAATPYDRPPPPRPLPKSPNWFSGVVVPSARAIASGAGKILCSIFSESGSSSSEDEDYASEDDIVNDNFPEIPCNQENTLNEKNATSLEMMTYRQESQLIVWMSETKKIIEQLIMKETFSSEERDRLIKVLNSRVIDWSTEAGEKSSGAGSPGNKLDHAVQEAKKWIQEKKAWLSSVTELAQGSSNLNPTMLEHVETGGGSPVDLARTYMKTRSPWMSSGRSNELNTPSTVSMKLFQEGTLYSAGHYFESSLENRRSFASGSWNIQEELRRVRSRAAEDMVCSPSTKTDPSHFAVGRGSAGAGEEVFALGERTIEPHSLRLHEQIDALADAGVSSLAALKSRQGSTESEALSSKPHTSDSGDNEVPEAVQADAGYSASKFIPPSSPNHAEEQHSDLHFSKVTKFVGRESAKGLPSSQVSISTGVAEHDDHMAYTSRENINTVEGNCVLLSEAYMEVPIMTRTSITASGCRPSLGVQYEGRPLGIAQPYLMEKHGITGGKQRGRNASIYYRRSRGRGK